MTIVMLFCCQVSSTGIVYGFKISGVLILIIYALFNVLHRIPRERQYCIHHLEEDGQNHGMIDERREIRITLY